MNEIFKLSDYKNIHELIYKIKEDFLNNYEYIVIRNNSNLIEECEIINYYNELNNLLGEVKIVDKNKYSDEDQNDYWVNVEYKFNSEKKNLESSVQPWKSNEELMLHTDNTLSNNLNFANITELVCIQPSDYSGETVIISNNKIIELVKYLDLQNNTNLYDNLLNTKIYHKSEEKNICIKEDSKYTFNFNITQILKSEFNKEPDLDVANNFSKVLNNIMNSSMTVSIKLEKGDALLFNDTLVMHGRKYVFGERLYKKCSILVF